MRDKSRHNKVVVYKKRMKKISLRIFIFFATFILLYVFACIAYPADETGHLATPDSYTIAMMLIPIISSIIVPQIPTFFKTNQKGKTHSDEVIIKGDSECKADPFESASVSPKCRTAKSSFLAVSPISKILTTTSYIVLDVETTGFSPTNDSLIEIAALKVVNGDIAERYESLIDPHDPIPPMITRITGISNQMVQGKPDISAVMAELDSFMDADLPIVAHNATFDLKFICANLDRVQRGRQLQYIDTLDLSRSAFPDLDNHKLETLISTLHLADGPQKHRAMSDAEATQKLFVKCQKALILRGGTTVSNDSAPALIIDDAEDNEEDDDPGFLLNQVGMKHEAKGEIDTAINYYEESVKAGFEGTHPYKRLAILYRKQHRYSDELRICDAALKMLEGRPNADQKIMDFEHRRTAVRGKLNKESSI